MRVHIAIIQQSAIQHVTSDLWFLRSHDARRLRERLLRVVRLFVGCVAGNRVIFQTQPQSHRRPDGEGNLGRADCEEAGVKIGAYPFHLFNQTHVIQGYIGDMFLCDRRCRRPCSGLFLPPPINRHLKMVSPASPRVSATACGQIHARAKFPWP